MNEQFEMIAKTMQGLEEVLAEELRNLGASDVEPGRRMVSFRGDLEMLYRANLSCHTALRILKPIYKFTADDTDSLYETAKEFDWSSVLSIDKTFCIDTVAFSEEFTHSQFVTYRVKDAIVDWFRDRYGDDKRPGVRLQNADVMINVHIAGSDITLSLDSSGESLHKRGYRVAQTEAPINEVLAAGIILRSGWRGDTTLIDPMCGSGTFLIEAALIAANINPGIYRKGFAFENWPDFDAELFDRLYNDDSNERDVPHRIIGADISPKAVEIASRNIKSAGVGKYIDLEVKPLSAWDEAPEGGIMITNPPYGERISADNMEGLYELIGNKLKNIFKGYHAWIIGYRKEYFDAIHLSPSEKIPLLNGSLECELREYVIFDGDYRTFRSEGGKIHHGDPFTPKRTDRRMPFSRNEERRSSFRDRDNFRDAKADGGFREQRGRDRFRNDRRHDDFRRDNLRDNDDAPRKPRFRDDRFRDNKEREDKFRDRQHFRDAKGDNGFREHRGGDRFRNDRRDNRDFRSYDNRGPRNKLEERYQSDSPRFNRFPKRVIDEPTHSEPSENPLAARRNERALRSIVGKQPSLLRNDNTIMRSRGWKKRDNNDESTPNSESAN